MSIDLPPLANKDAAQLAEIAQDYLEQLQEMSAHAEALEARVSELEGNSSYDSRPETYEHIGNVRWFMLVAVKDLLDRLHTHDESKLHSPEREAFDSATPKLKDLTYGSDEYRAALAEIKPALEHHYRTYRHHPEHFKNGIGDMNLIDLLEMICDWKAASLRHDDGDIRYSVITNAERFGYGPEMERILLNTIDYLGLG